MSPNRTAKIGQYDLLYGSKSTDEKVGVNRHFKASWALQPTRSLFNVLAWQSSPLICTPQQLQSKYTLCCYRKLF